MRAFAPVFLAAIVAAAPANAVSNYVECANFATIDPEKTLVDAQEWYDATGDVGARHCMAIAQAELGAHRTAANTLMEVANAGIDKDARISTLVEATRQWRLAGAMEAARSTIDSAIRISPAPIALIERAS